MTPIHICIATWLAVSLSTTSAPAGPGPPAPSQIPDYGTYSWPLHGPVIRGFEPPPSPYEAGHRGIDIGAPFGTDVGASREGIVAFAGWVAGSLFVSIDHSDGVRTTYSWLSDVRVTKGQSVERRQLIGRSGHGHPDVPDPHLHFGARVGSNYIDPMLLLEGADVSGLIHLAPLMEGMMRASSLGDGHPPTRWLPSVGLRGWRAPTMGGLEPWRSRLTPRLLALIPSLDVDEEGGPRLRDRGWFPRRPHARAGPDVGESGVLAGAPGWPGPPGGGAGRQAPAAAEAGLAGSP